MEPAPRRTPIHCRREGEVATTPRRAPGTVARSRSAGKKPHRVLRARSGIGLLAGPSAGHPEGIGSGVQRPGREREVANSVTFQADEQGETPCEGLDYRA